MSKTVELIFKTLKSFFIFPYYDTTTGKINNCDKYSNSWFHEMRHVNQCNKKLYKNLAIPILIYSQYLGYFFFIMFLIEKEIRYSLVILGIFSIPNLIITIILEFDAYLFGYIDYLKYKKKLKLRG